MLKAMIEKIENMAAPRTFELEGKTYSNKELHLVHEKKRQIREIELTGLDSVCKMIRNESEMVGLRLFVQIVNHKTVKVFSTFDVDYDRQSLYYCTADVPGVTTGRYLSYDAAVVELRSLYIPNEGTEYLLQLLSSITKESKVTSSDNGVTQKVEAKSGIALNSLVTVRPRVMLRPFRTFIEVEQPESEFLLRINDRGEIGIFPADGGVWKLEATRNVADYFEAQLEDLIRQEKVVVIR